MANILEQLYGSGLQEITPQENLDNLHFSDSPEENLDNLYESFDVREMEMIQDIRDCVESDERLKLENWQELDMDARQETLQGLENRIAAIESRNPLNIVVEDMGPSLCGYMNQAEGIIAINTTEIMDDSISGLRELVDTVVHEGRHAYQHENVFGVRTEQNDAKFMGWVSNYQTGYLDSETYGQELYLLQPLEADAWAFAGATVSGLDFR